MRVRSFLLVVTVSLLVFSPALFSQAPPPAQVPASRMPGMGTPNPQLEAKQAEVAPTAAVITIEGFCQNAAAKPCQTTVTKADFEKLMHALDPNMQPQGRQSLADQYSKIAVMAGEARKRNLENEPRTQEVLRFVQMQVLANLYNQQLQEKAKEVPAAEVEKYYNEHKTDFDEASVRRIYIPKNVPADAKKMSDAERTALANDIDKRAKAGEDFNALQKDVFEKMGIKSPPPPTDMGAQRRSSYSPQETAAIFALAPGQVSDVVDTQIGDFIYKVVSKRTLTVDEARPDIQSNLQRQRYTSELEQVFAPISVQLNPEYFGGTATVSLPGHTPPMPSPPGTQPAPGAVRPATPPPASKPPGN